jgi:hypothetical protein
MVRTQSRLRIVDAREQLAQLARPDQSLSRTSEVAHMPRKAATAEEAARYVLGKSPNVNWEQPLFIKSWVSRILETGLS